MKYLNYNDMKKDFYTIDGVCYLFEMNKRELKSYSECYNIVPKQNQYGNWGFSKVYVRKLHNFIYKEQKNNNSCFNKSERKCDPWA